MTNYFKIFFLIVFFQFGTISLFAGIPEIINISPKPGSDYNYIDSKIIIRFSENISKYSINEKAFIVNGNKTGFHNGEFIVSDDGLTLIFKPYQNFLSSENVSINISEDLFKSEAISSKDISFKTSNSETSLQPIVQKYYDDDEIGKPFFKSLEKGDKILEDLPEITFPVNDANKAYKGYILISASEPQGKRNYAIILDYLGNVYKWRSTNPYPFNFRLQPNGYFAYSESISGVATQAVSRILDMDLNLVASYQTGNGYKSFPAEFMLLPNGHIIMVALDQMPVNMRDIVPTGDPNATVIGSVVQELDKNMNVVFQWRSFDYTDITDSYENLASASFRALHLNGVDVDMDGNYLFSIRHFAQVMKVNRNTGEIMWRLGGKKNDFTFINENEQSAPLYFSHQHDVRRQSNGNITFFDNGNMRAAPQYSRAVEYKLDENKKTATLVWEYRNNPDVYAPNRGSVQILPNGNYLIGIGSTSTSSSISAAEVIPSTNELVMSYVLPSGFESYRTFKIDLPPCQPVADFKEDELLELNTYNFNNAQNNTGISIEFKKLESSIPYNSFTVKKYNCSPLNPEFDGEAPLLLINKVTFAKTVIANFTGEVILDLTNYANNVTLNEPKVFFRSTIDSGKFELLPTTYDAATKKVKFTIYNIGEICIGGYFDNEVPLGTNLISPKHEAILNKNKVVKFVWSPLGRYNSSSLYLYTKDNDDIVLFKKVDSIRATSYTFSDVDFDVDQVYSWMVTSSNDNGKGDRSKFFDFSLKDSFISLLTPNGGEILIRDSISYVIKWMDNLDDIVKIELLDNGQSVLVIADSLQSQLNNIKWTIPASVPVGKNYKIQVTSIPNGNLTTTSENVFEIIDKSTEVSDNELKELYNISVFPNPASDNLNISLNSDKIENIDITIVDLNGVEQQAVSKELNFGTNKFSLNLANLYSGVYIVKVKLLNGTYSQKFLKIK